MCKSAAGRPNSINLVTMCACALGKLLTYIMQDLSIDLINYMSVKVGEFGDQCVNIAGMLYCIDALFSSLRKCIMFTLSNRRKS